MKCIIICFFLILLNVALIQCQCHLYGKDWHELYCENFKSPIAPEKCQFAWNLDKIKVYSSFKSRGCDLTDIVEWLGKSTIENLDISYSNYKKDHPVKIANKFLVKLNASYSDLPQISVIYFDDLINLAEIDFSFNKINFIGRNDFSGAEKLTTIHLSNNAIDYIADKAFAHLNLSFLDLTNNSIALVGKLFHENVNLKTLLLNKNPITDFDCDLVWLAKNGASVQFSWDSIKKSNEVRIIFIFFFSFLFHFIQKKVEKWRSFLNFIDCKKIRDVKNTKLF